MNKSIPLYGVVNTSEMEGVAIEVMRSGQLANGKYVREFERSFGDLIGCQNVVTTSDMTSALFLALHLAGISEGDEVLTTAFACLATNSAIAQLKAKPKWVDVEPSTVEISIKDLLLKISDKTKALILYHVAGYPGPIQEVREICDAYGIALIEDCDNALLAKRDADLVGSLGDFAVYSFYPNRQINGIEGGALICKDHGHADRARRLRRFGVNLDSFRGSNGEINPLSDVPEIGWSIGMNNLSSAVALKQIPTVIDKINQTRENASMLSALVKKISGVQVIPVLNSSLSSFWALLILVENRDFVLDHLKKQGVLASVLHYRNDQYTGFGAVPDLALINTKYIQDHLIGLPCGWWLSGDDLIEVAEALKSSVSKRL